MLFQTIRPSSDLQKYIVNYFLYSNIFENETVLPCIPGGVPALILMLNYEGIQQSTITCFDHTEKLPFSDIVILGQFSQGWAFNVKGQWNTLIIVLQPLGLYHLLHESPLCVTNKIMPLGKWHPNSKQVLHMVWEEKNILQQIGILEAFLSKCFKERKSSYPIASIIHEILKSNGSKTIEEISKSEKTTERTLHRNFVQKIGLSPKEFSKIVKFKSIKNHLHDHPASKIQDLAYRFDYHDTSHLVKDFRRYTGLPPSQYVREYNKFDSNIVKVFTSTEYRT